MNTLKTLSYGRSKHMQYYQLSTLLYVLSKISNFNSGKKESAILKFNLRYSAGMTHNILWKKLNFLCVKRIEYLKTMDWFYFNFYFLNYFSMNSVTKLNFQMNNCKNNGNYF